MPKSGFTLGVLVTIFWLHFGISIQAQPGDAKPGTAAISGRVTMSGEPVANVIVALQNPRGSSSSMGRRVKTDGDGRFRFTGVAAGRYVLGALAPGYISTSDHLQGPQGVMIAVSEGENMEGVSIELKRGGAIAGRVTDSRGRPVAEEGITLIRMDEQGRPQYFNHPMSHFLFNTDDRGFYRIFGLPAGRYLVSVGTASSYWMGGRRIVYLRTFHPDATVESKARIVELSEGGEVTGVDITIAEMERAYTVSGRIVDAETGQPVEGIEIAFRQVMAYGRMGGLRGRTISGSDAKGGFQFMLPPGKYSLSGGWSDGDYVIEPVTIEVSDKDVGGVEIKARKGATISGVVTIEGAYGRTILAKLPSLTLVAEKGSNDPIYFNSRSARINPDGRFRISGLAPGKITFSLSGAPEAKRLHILRVERGAVSQGRQIEVGAGEQAQYLRVVFVYGAAAIRGQLKIIGGEIPSEILVYAGARPIGSDASAYFSAQVDASGQFVIEGLPAGEYELRLSYQRRVNPFKTDLQLLRKFLRQMQQAKQTVSVGATGETKVTLTLDLSQEGGQ